MAHYGLWIGVGLVLLAIASAILLGAKAARSVVEFRAEEHESFKSEERP